ncbi:MULTISPECIES: hypothetical protein [Enterobacter]|nr:MULTISPECIES: hypothetical protein [Enterobacter]ASA03579.1 hypothetical protein AM432_06935 [Enterobacter cloacae complex sp.]CAE7069696.1 hypothetical protein AI2697V1_1577 [Enterobacter cloacae]HAV1816884.1 hypothetical protein [Enterobacter hormaechei subsp. steigerwaltii]ALA02738.1 hypothetical protein LI63_015810 [Enterobacter hormaechei subsp. xiangfangensis]APR41134.1 hypothetical protein AM329_03390 [Enterobacter cloacae complex sp. AR_0002]
MAVQFDCFLNVAKDSLDKSGETWTRNAISRAYYYMFHAVRDVINKPIPKNDKSGNPFPFGEHKRLSEYLCNGDAATDYNFDAAQLEKIGLKLRAAHHKRCDADYELHLKMNRLEAIKLLAVAENIKQEVDKLKQPE